MTKVPPITPLYIKDMNRSCFIVLSQTAYDLMIKTYMHTQKTDFEVPFFLFGHIEDHGKYRTIVFYKGMYNDKDLLANHASFNPLARGIDAEMYRFLVDNDAESAWSKNEGGNQQFRKAVRCYGHTHPPNGGDCFSFADLACTVEHSMLNEYYSSDEMESLDVLITTKGDFNFIKYEKNELFECFLKYPNVFVKKDNGTIQRLKSYENGNYCRPL